MTRRIYVVLVLVWMGVMPVARPADQTVPEVREMRLEPSTTKVPLGHARLTVEPLVTQGSGLGAGYKVEVSVLGIGNEAGKMSVAVSADSLRRLAGGEQVGFTGQAVSNQGDNSKITGTATPSGGDAGAVRIRVDGKKGKLVFKTTYHLVR